MTAPHTVHRTVTDDGWRASCTCGWRTVRPTRQLRDQDADTHELTTTTSTRTTRPLR